MNIKVTSENAKQRIDKFIVEQLKGTDNELSRVMVQKMIEDGSILLNGNQTTANDKLKVDDEISIAFEAPVKSELKPEDHHIQIVYEDDDLAVVEKPNNMVVHPANGNNTGTLVNALLYQLKNLSGIGGVERPGIVHRLDKQTSGLLVIAKNDKTHKLLSEMLKKHQVKKEYMALVQGTIVEDKGMIDAPIGRNANDRKKMDVTSKNSKEAVTHFEVVERFPKATLVKVQIDTGRTHQIRVHFKYIKHPVLNDPQYGYVHEKTTDFGQYLHAYKLTFKHPITGKTLTFESPLPKEFNDRIELLRKGE